jgi:large subunit ribosomal protein L17
MRHRVKITGIQKTRGRTKAQAKSLITALFKHDVIKTTKSRADKMAPVVERIIVAVKGKNEKDAIRYLQKYINEEEVSKKILSETKGKLAHIDSGYTKIYKLDMRKGDAAPMVQIQLNTK